MIDLLLKVAKSNPDGFTVSIPSLTFVSKGIVCAYEATQGSFGKKGLKTCIEHTETHNNVIGGWLEVEAKRYYFDSCHVFDNLQDAIDFGKANNQIAVYDLNTLSEIRL